jgi:hypothetical protein
MPKPDFENFLEQYESWLHEVADDFAVIMSREITGIYRTVSADARAAKEWDEFVKFVDGPAPFKEKYERYLKLKQQACGLPTRIQ